MGGCFRKSAESVTKAQLSRIPKQYDVFVSHHQGAEDGFAPSRISEFYAGWAAEVCSNLSMAVFIDKTNLGRLMDETKLMTQVAGSRCLVAVVNGSSLTDPHGMQQELWWAHLAGVPIVPFYDGDRHAPEAFASWQRDFPHAFKRRPVVYQRQKHFQAKDALVSAVHDALLEAYAGELPELLAEVLEKHAEKQKRREKRVKKRAQQAKRLSGSSEQPVGSEDASKKDDNDKEQSAWGKRNSDKRKRFAGEAPLDEAGDGAKKKSSGKRASFSEDVSQPEDEGSDVPTAPADKRFRFRDEEAPAAPPDEGGVARLLRGIRDPLGRREQEQRTAMLEGRGMEEEGKFEPRGRDAKPVRGILKGRSVEPPAPKRVMTRATIDASMQAGIDRLLDYLKSVGADDAAQLPTVLRVMKLTMPSEEVVTRSLQVVFEFVQDSDRGRRNVAKNSGIENIVEAMGMHGASMDVQTYGCGCLYALSCFRPDNPQKDNNSAVIAHSGGIGRLTEAMATFSTCREIQQWGVGALRHLAVEIGTNRREVSDVGEIKLTMRGINKRMIAKLGGIELVVQAMLKFPDEAELQENGCAALCNLASNRQETKVRAARAGSIRAAVNAMRMLPGELELQSLACALLRSLALGVPENKVAIVAQGGVRQLCAAIAQNRSDSEICVQATAALCNLTSHVAENKRAICDAGGLELAIGAMRNLPSDAELQQQGLVLLHNLAIDPVLRNIVITAGGAEIAAAAAQHENESVRPLGQMLLRQLGAAPADAGDGGDEDGGADVSGANDLGALFAPRRAESPTKRGSAAGSSRSKTLTKPQRKLMGEVMESMQREPQEWLPETDSDGGSTVSKTSVASFSVRRGKRQEQSDNGSSAGGSSIGNGWATQFGVEDLEGSDAEHMAGRGGGRPLALVVKPGSNSPAEKISGGRDESSTGVFGVRRSGLRSGSGAAGDDDVGSDVESTERSSVASEDDTYGQSGFSAQAATGESGRGLEREDSFASSVSAAIENVRPFRARHSSKDSPRPTFEDYPMKQGWGQFTRKQWRSSAPAESNFAGAADGADDLRNVARLTEDALRDRDTFSDAGSEARSEASFGGVIDLFDDDAANLRTRKRRRQSKRGGGQADGNEENIGAALLRELLCEVEVEVEAPPKPRRVKKARPTAAQKKFSSALKKCADAPEERRRIDDWDEILRLQRGRAENAAMRGAKAALETSATKAALVRDNLDGLTKATQRKLRQGTNKASAGAKGLAGRVRQEGLMHVVQTSHISRRLQYGLDDDEESIFGIDGLEELGEAEAALLDMLGDMDAKDGAAKAEAAEYSTGQQTTVSKGKAPTTDADRLRALSLRLEQKRESKRRVKLL